MFNDLDFYYGSSNEAKQCENKFEIALTNS